MRNFDAVSALVTASSGFALGQMFREDGEDIRTKSCEFFFSRHGNAIEALFFLRIILRKLKLVSVKLYETESNTQLGSDPILEEM